MVDRSVLSVAEEQRSAQIAGYYDAGAAEHVKRKYRAELGPQLCDLLEDPDVTDIYKNPHSDFIWVKTHSKGTYVTTYRMDNARSLNLIGTIAGAYNLEISPNSPRLEAPLPFHGARFSAKIQPNVAGPSWFLRKRTSHIRTLDDYVADGIATREQADTIESFVAQRHNILVGGPMGAGKTSIANAILYAMHQHDTPDERYCILEDTPELQCMAPNRVEMITCPQLGIGMNELLHDALRFGFTRLCIGEIRSAASTLLEAWTTGHSGGIATIHGGSPEEVMRRFEILLRRDNFPIERDAVIQAIRAIVIIQPSGTGRVVRHVMVITGAGDAGYQFADPVHDRRSLSPPPP